MVRVLYSLLRYTGLVPIYSSQDLWDLLFSECPFARNSMPISLIIRPYKCRVMIFLIMTPANMTALLGALLQYGISR